MRSFVRWCVGRKDNIFYCIDFKTKREALDYIRKHDLGERYFIFRSYVLPL